MAARVVEGCAKQLEDEGEDEERRGKRTVASTCSARAQGVMGKKEKP